MTGKLRNALFPSLHSYINQWVLLKGFKLVGLTPYDSFFSSNQYFGMEKKTFILV